VADGGEGTLAALLTALGGSTGGASVSDPLGRAVRAGFGLLEDGATAVVEVAEASGLGRVAEGERDAEAASSRGTGELIVAAVEGGAQVVLVAAGGSATTDGGLARSRPSTTPAGSTGRGWSCCATCARPSKPRRLSSRPRRAPMRRR